jgi:hypothetical protein
VRLPPVELYRIGETYFVKDGNHRVSVAREHGQVFVDAVVTELHAPVPIGSVAELEGWLRRQDAVAFLSQTHLLELRPDARIELTLPGHYARLLEHIAVHRWFAGIEAGRPVIYTEAVASWYDRVYSPLVDAIRETHILRDFPQRTEADLYLWLSEHLWYVHQAGYLEDAMPVDAVARAFATRFSSRLRRRLARLIQARTLRMLGVTR